MSSLPQELSFDAPLTDISKDKMARSVLILAITNALIEKVKGRWKSTGACVAVSGQWGTGKTSLLNFVGTYLDAQADVIVIRFEPWLVSETSETIASYFRELTRALGKSPSERARDLANALDDYRGAIEGVASYALPFGSLIAKFFPKVRRKTVSEQRNKISKKLRNFKGAIVVVIDELDRADELEVLEVIRFVNSIGNLPNISYLLAYDFERVKRIVENDENDRSGEEYLKKIVQLDVPLRAMFDYELTSLLSSAMPREALAQLEADEERWSEARAVTSRLLETPRDVKRASSSFRLLDRAVGREVDRVDLFVYAVLQASSLSVVEGLHKNLDRVVVDPHIDNMDFMSVLREDRKSEQTVLDKIGLKRPSYLHHEAALRFLFPNSRTSAQVEAFGRLCERKNLLAVSYLGNPPFRVSRTEIEEFWQNPTNDKLRNLKGDNEKVEFVVQVGKLFSTLDPDKDVEALLVLTSGIRAGAIEARNARSIVEAVVRSIFEKHIPVEEQRHRLETVFYGLRDAGELAITASLVRAHMFEYGIAGDRSGRGEPMLFAKADFEEIMPSELERYADKISAQSWIEDGVSIDCFFAIEQGGAWGKELRDALEDAISDQAKVSLLAALFSPPGWSFEAGTMERFLSEEQLRAALNVGGEADPYLVRCRERMSRLLDGVRWTDL